MKFLSLLIAVTTLLSGVSAEMVWAADGNPPPPTLDTMQFLVPKHLRIQFNMTIYPSYVSWLSNSNGVPDSAAVFQLYLAAQPITRFDRLCFMQLYLELQAGG